MKRTIILFAVLFGLTIATAGSEVIPSISDTIVIQDWLLCGPFSVGAREGITGVIENPMKFKPVESETLRCGLAQGGEVVWHKIQADSAGWIETNYQNVRWDSIMDYYGYAGLLAVGYAYAEFERPKSCRALAITHRTGFILNGKAYQGDAYGHGWLRTPVILDSGTNRVILSISGFADRKVRFMLVPALSPLMTVCGDATVPDAIADSSITAWLGIPILNCTSSRVDSLVLTISMSGDSVLAETTVSNLPALGVKKVPTCLTIPEPSADTGKLPLVVSVRWQDYSYSDTVRLRIRKPDESHKVTFRSYIDNSCQYYGILYPKDFDPERRYALILSLHGAGVEASGLVNCYKPKDWAFVVAPTNRRPYGFDWQDWGRLDAIEVLDTILARLPIDPDRVYLTGHSMGGHGTWHVGLAHPDRFAAAGVGAGWPSFQLYIPWFLQRTKVFAEPAQQAIHDMALASDNAPAFLVNALNLPFFIQHGGDDDNVPTIHGRKFAKWLQELGYKYTYKEVPGRKHWWTYENGISSVDDPDMMAFFKSKTRNPGPRHVLFRTADLEQSNHAYWITINLVRTGGKLAQIEAWASHKVVKVTTRNIAQFTLDLDQKLFFPGNVTLEINSQHLRGRISLPAHITVHEEHGRWKFGKARVQRLHKKPELYGPAKQTMFRPFLLVYGTVDTNLTSFLYHAATQEGMRWWLRGNGLAEVLPDSEVTPEMEQKYNLVLYGGPDENSYTCRINRKLPLQNRQGRMFLGSHDLGDSLAAIFVYPNPESQKHLVLVRMGTDPENTKLSMFWGILHSGAGIPDFMVFDKQVRHWAWAGVKAAGFFSPIWNIDQKSAYIQ